MRTQLQLSDLDGLKILSRQHQEDPNSLLIFTNLDLWVTGAVMQQLSAICNQYVHHINTLWLRKELDRKLLECIRANVTHVSLAPLAGWAHMQKATDTQDFARKWEIANGDVSDAEPRFQKP